MANYKLKPLPAPNEAIAIAAERYQWGIYIEYRAANLTDLLAAGCITQSIVDRLSEPRQRDDEEGDPFFRRKRPTKAQPNRCVITRMVHLDKGGEAKALALPGVADCLNAQQPKPDALPRIETAAVRVSEATGEDCLTKRTRAVGRFQRAVSWIAAGNLIFPDWPTIRACAVGGAP